MAQFNKWIRVNSDQLEFCFTEILELGYVRDFVTVVDADRQLHCFNMKKDKDNNWKIQETSKLPFWIVNLADELSDVIKDKKKGK